MKERHIRMNGPMVRATLAGTKTQARLIVKPQPVMRDGGWYWTHPRYDNGMGVKYFHTGEITPSLLKAMARCYGQPGDRLWVRETWNKFPPWEGYFYAADDHSFGIGECDDSDHIEPQDLRWKPSIHMPREASRLTLEITEVRVERLNEISEKDARAEGCKPHISPASGVEIPWWQGYKDLNGQLVHQEHMGTEPPEWMIEPKRMKELPHLNHDARRSFELLWESINGPGSWAANPWVWVVSFRRLP